MSVRVLLAAPSKVWDEYQAPLEAALEKAGMDADLRTDFPPDQVDYIIYAPNPAMNDFTPYTRAKAVLSLWAGVEDIVTNPTLTQPLARMVDADLTQGMVEWVSGHVLRHHLGMDAHIVNPDHAWVAKAPPLARDCTVAMLGLGALGQACALALSGLGFAVEGWSRSPKSLPGLPCHAGPDALDALLARARIVVLLLPLTAETENLINTRTLAMLPKGAVIINPGRGPLIDDHALLAALECGHVAHATLDVFRQEPLPRDHPFWANPRVTVTPHIASETRAPSASMVIAENIRRCEAGEPLRHVVDRATGY